MFATTLKRTITIKRVIIIAYVVSVLLIAGLSQASDFSVIPVTKVEVSHRDQLVRIQGIKTNSCQKVPKPKVLRIDRIARHITMQVVSPNQANQICTQALEGKFQIVVNIASFKLPPNIPFKLTVVGAPENVRPITITYNGASQNSPFSSTDATGILIREVDGFSLQTRNEYFKIAPSHLDLEDHVGNIVDIAGHKIEFGLEPVEIESSNETGESSNSLVLTGISSSN